MKLSSTVAKEYRRRFDKNDRRRFRRKKITPQKALSYSERFEGHSIDWLVENNISSEKAEEYPPRFQGWQIAYLVNRNISPEKAGQYPEQLNAWNIGKLAEGGVTGPVAREYDPSFSVQEILILAEAGCTPKKVNKYRQKVNSLTGQRENRFGIYEIVSLWKKRIKPEIAIQYAERFSGFDISDSLKDIPSEIANAYPKRFQGDAVKYLVKRKISPEIASKYRTRFTEMDIYRMQEINCPPSVANKYADHLITWQLPDLFIIGCLPKTANKYDPRFDIDSVLSFFISGFTPELVNSFSTKFQDWHIHYMLEAGVSPEFANNYAKNTQQDKLDYKAIIEQAKQKGDLQQFGRPINETTQYDGRFSVHNVQRIARSHCTASEANKFDFNQFSPNEITELICSGARAETVSRYPKKLSKWQIYSLAKHSCFPESLKKYDKRFRIDDIVELAQAHCRPNIANAYCKELKAYQIAILYKIGIEPESTSKKEQKRIKKLIFPKDQKAVLDNKVEKYKIIGTGASGIVLVFDGSNDKSAWKIGKDLTHEANLLIAVRKKHKKPKNVVKIRQKHRPKMQIFEMDYAGKSTLDELVKKGPLEPQTALNYAYGIMNGLLELRYSGIMQHRDLRPANILVEDSKERVKIVDLGIATTDRNSLPLNNRRFGGPNDLVSLGQIMYYMCTGQHIFSQSQSMSLTLAADDIKDYRFKVYADPTGELLEQCLEKVDTEIKNAALRKLIKKCLTAKESDYKKIDNLFRTYLKPVRSNQTYQSPF